MRITRASTEIITRRRRRSIMRRRTVTDPPPTHEEQPNVRLCDVRAFTYTHVRTTARIYSGELGAAFAIKWDHRSSFLSSSSSSSCSSSSSTSRAEPSPFFFNISSLSEPEAGIVFSHYRRILRSWSRVEATNTNVHNGIGIVDAAAASGSSVQLKGLIDVNSKGN